MWRALAGWGARAQVTKVVKNRKEVVLGGLTDLSGAKGGSSVGPQKRVIE